MGTRSLTFVMSGGKQKIITMYRQMDGYPQGHGLDLYNAFGQMYICNGIGTNQSVGKWANGMECLAAQVVAHFKEGIGGIYLYPTSVVSAGQEYEYYLYPNEGKELCIKVMEVHTKYSDNFTVDKITRRTLYKGLIADFGRWLTKDRGE